MSVPKHWLLGGSYPRGLTVHHQSYQSMLKWCLSIKIGGGRVLFSLNGILPLHFLPDCKDLPAIRNATCVERFGLYRNIGRGSKFKCNEGFSMLGRPFSVCKTDGHWQNMFACVENRMFKLHDKSNFSKFLSSFQSFDCNHWKHTDSTTLTAKHNHLIKQSKYFSNTKIKQKTYRV